MYAKDKEVYSVKKEYDSNGKIIFDSYSDGFSTERTFDPDYKNGEVPAIAREYENGKLVYWREYDNVIVDDWYGIDKRKEMIA